MTDAPTLNTLAKQLYAAKQCEKTAKEARIAIEEAIADLVTIDGDAGSRTQDAGDGLKVTVTRKMNYKADVDAIRDIDFDLSPTDPDLPLKHTPASYTFDAAAYEKLRDSNPAVAAKVAEYVTVTPAKVAVTLKLS